MSTEKNFFVIVNYNSGNHIISSIKSILSSKNIEPHIIVVDNASCDDSLKKCKQSFPLITYISNSHNTGFGSGANIGIKHAIKNDAHTVTLINPDAFLEKNCMFHILQKMKQDKCDIVSPVIYKNKDGDMWFSGGYIDFLHMRAIHIPTKNALNPLPQNAFISGCVMTISRNVFEKIGFFDENFFLYYEDADFSFRAQNNGFNLAIAENACAYHDEVSENFKENKTYYLVLSGLIFFSKHTKYLQKLYFKIHYMLRKIKNYFDRMQKKQFSEVVHAAFIDYEKNK